MKNRKIKFDSGSSESFQPKVYIIQYIYIHDKDV